MNRKTLQFFNEQTVMNITNTLILYNTYNNYFRTFISTYYLFQDDPDLSP